MTTLASAVILLHAETCVTTVAASENAVHMHDASALLLLQKLVLQSTTFASCKCDCAQQNLDAQARLAIFSFNLKRGGIY